MAVNVPEGLKPYQYLLGKVVYEISQPMQNIHCVTRREIVMLWQSSQAEIYLNEKTLKLATRSKLGLVVARLDNQYGRVDREVGEFEKRRLTRDEALARMEKLIAYAEKNMPLYVDAWMEIQQEIFEHKNALFVK